MQITQIMPIGKTFALLHSNSEHSTITFWDNYQLERSKDIDLTS